MTFDPKAVEVTCVSLPKDHCARPIKIHQSMWIPGVSILQENPNYSPALNIICQILPQILPHLQSYRCLLTRGIDPFFDIFLWFCGAYLLTRGIDSFFDIFRDSVGHDSTKCPLGPTGGCLKGDVPPSEAGKKIVFLKLESCNLMNTFGHKFREQAMS